MILHYLKNAYRNVKRHRLYSLINVFSLTLGLTVFLLIMNYIIHEISYDRYHEDSNRIFRICSTYRNRSGELASSPIQPPALGPLVETEFSGIETSTRVFTYAWKETALVSHGDKQFYEKKFFLADEKFYDVFSARFIQGNPETALKDVNSLVITEEASRKYFGNEDPMGKTITVANMGQVDYVVTGVVKDVPENSHFTYDFLGSMKSGNRLFWEDFDEGWRGSGFYTYVKLGENAVPARIEKELDEWIHAYRKDVQLFLQALTEIHLHSHMNYEIEPNSSVGVLWFFALAGLFVLVVACINYINLSYARAGVRAREIGARKVAGAGRWDLTAQFLGESVFHAVLVLPLVIAAVHLLHPVLCRIINKDFGVVFFDDIRFAGLGLLTVLCVGFAAGLYPALVLSGLRPVNLIRRQPVPGKGVSKNILVIVQFFISGCLIIASLVVRQQMNYIQSSNPGYQKQDILVIQAKDFEAQQTYTMLKQKLLELPGVKHVTASSALPSNVRSSHLVRSGDVDNEQEVRMDWLAVDYDFISTYGLTLALGRDFSKDYSSDSDAAYILNEQAVKTLGLATPVNTPFQLSNKGLRKKIYGSGTVIGVVKDFHFRSFHSDIQPLVLKIYPHGLSYISVHVQHGSMSKQLPYIKTVWASINPGRPFDYFFFDTYIDQLYASEARTQFLFQVISVLAICISILGLSGLMSFNISRRRKELGIRKVLGASHSSVLMLFLKDVLILVVIANAAAWPVAWYGITLWLRNFAYHIPLTVWPFLLSGFIALGVTLTSVGVQSLKEAGSNPVEAIRHE